jgi:hypothetical protein
MYINNTQQNIREKQKLSNWPLSIEAKTTRHCNVTEGQKLLRYDLNYGFFETNTPEGFYVFITDTVTVVDNRWPGVLWNLTNTTPSSLSCPGVILDITITSSRAGEATQMFTNVPPTMNVPVLMRFDSLYTIIGASSDPNDNYEIGIQQYGPFGIDDKFDYRGTNTWFHYVLWRDDADPNCESNFRLDVMNTSSVPNSTSYMNVEELPEIPMTRPKF